MIRLWINYSNPNNISKVYLYNNMKSNHFPVVFSKSGSYSHRKLYIPKPQISNFEETTLSPVSRPSVLPTIAKYNSKSPLLPRNELPFASMSRNISTRKSLGPLFKTNEAKQDIKSAMGMIRIKDFLRDSRNAESTNMLTRMHTEDPYNYGMTPSTSTSTREVCFPYIKKVKSKKGYSPMRYDELE